MRNTPKTPIEGAHALGQSFWLDYIRRGLIESGELADLIQRGEIRGMTSNPTIFEQAIAASDDYVEALRPMAHAGWLPEKVLDELMIEDVRAAADLFLPLYEETNGGDGFVSIEVNPKLAYETDGTLREVRRLWSVVNRPNLMVKIPATQAGILAIQQAIAEGVNVNVTLLFSLDRYAEVIDAYLRGLEARHRAGDSINHVASVASFFVSRIDTAVDAQLESIIHQNIPKAERAGALRGKAAIASARLAYAHFEGAFSSPRFEALRQHGARPQRPLWASTSTKNPSYPDTYYVDSLIGADTVNTLPPHTLVAFRDHGKAEPMLRANLAADRAILDALGALGVSMRDVSQRLEDEGVEKFAASYSALLKQVRTQLLRYQKELGPLLPAFRETLRAFEADYVAKRLWDEDASLWTQDRSKAEAIRQRLGWLRLPETSRADLKELTGFVGEGRAAGFENAALLGMGGSALAADVMRRMLGGRDGLRLQVLDSTDPAEVLRVSGEVPPSCSLFIVSSKSGTTVEPLALLEYFWQRTEESPSEKPGDRFIAITDPGTRLESLARERGFRRVFSGPPTVGGRYSALSRFGLVPATLMGLDIEGMVAGAERMARRCAPGVDGARNPGLYLGAILGAAYEQGRTKVTFLADQSVGAFADWIEQLMAESTGKDGKGLVPVVGEPPGPARAYGDDRVMVYLRTDGQYDRQVRGWVRARVPVVILPMAAREAGLGAEFFRWEMAIAAAAHVMGVNPFDEPDVKGAKDRTTALLDARRRGKKQALPSLLWEGQGIGVRGEDPEMKNQAPGTLADMITYLFGGLGPDDAVTLLVYREPSAPLSAHLARLRKRIRDRLKATTTLGFGPRYLHSTGQLHKGGPDHSLYLVLTMTASADVEVPTMGVTFGELEHAQALGDLQALLTLGRRAYGLHASSRHDFERLLSAFLSAIR